MQTTTIVELGELAAQVLAPSVRGRVLGSSEHALWLQTEGGDVLWVDDRHGAFGRRGLLCEAALRGAAPGETFRVEEQAVVLESGSVLLLAGAKRVPSRPLCALPLSEEDRALRVERLRPVLDERPGADSPVATYIATQTQRFVTDIAKGAPFTVAAPRIVGLGVGLTPSGDDFLGGFACGRFAVGDPLSLSDEEFSQIFGATHALSRARLEDHLRGEPTRDERSFVESLIAGVSPYDDLDLPSEDAPLSEAARVLSATGQSSGWEFMAGACAALTIEAGPAAGAIGV